MPYHDLNLPCPPPTSTSTLTHSLTFASELGYSVIACSISINGKVPAVLPTVPISDITPPPNLTLLTRLNLTISDTSQNHRLSHLAASYSLLALRPTNEKSFQLCCGSLDCDIISLDVSQRLPFILKFKTVSSALQRGIRFEICYSPGVVGGSDARRNVISGATSLIRATRGRGIILSSEAKTALGLRAPHDVMNLAQIWGLGQERGKEAVCEEADRVVRLARLKRETYRGVIKIVDGGGPSKDVLEAQAKEEEAESQARSQKNKEKWTAQTNGTNDLKRKASTTSLNPPPVKITPDEPPLSKREQKRRAKKARFEARMNYHKDPQKDKNNHDNIGTNNSFPIKHEALLAGAANTKVVSKKS